MKSKVIAIHQPNYIPWLGYFYKIFESDVFVFLNDAQFSNSGAHNYHYIKTPQGALRLKIPLEYKHGDKINEVKTKDNLKWKDDHLRKIELNYKKAPFFKEIYDDFDMIISKDYLNLSDQNVAIIKFFVKKLGIDTQFTFSSDLNLQTVREEKVLDICSVLNGTTYVSGTGAKAYQKEENFLDRGIELVYSKFKPFEFKQLWGDPFQSNVSIIDYVMNYGYDWDFVLQNIKTNE